MHKGRQRPAERDDARLAPQHLTRRIRRILTELAAAQSAQDMELPSSLSDFRRLFSMTALFSSKLRLYEWRVRQAASDRLHPLKCDRRVSGNWRIVFRFVEGEVVDVDLIDYH